MAKKLDSTYKSARFGSCTYALILDKRHPKKDRNTFPVAMRYTIDRKSWYNYVAGEFTEEDFAKVCNRVQRLSALNSTKKSWNLMPSLRHRWS